MRYFYDTEFVEDGRTIDLISIGIVAEDGREYYAVNDAVGYGGKLHKDICRHKWLCENVIPHLPLAGSGRVNRHDSGYEWYFSLDTSSVLVKPTRVIANEVRDFLIGRNELVELWGYYCAYDHIVLAQLFGSMMRMPKGIPMWTNDVQQIVAETGLEASLPAQKGTAHNALDDARWTKEAWEYLALYKRLTGWAGGEA